MPEIFVFGAGRSGTTMLGGIIGSAPSALCIPEAQFIYEGLLRFGMEHQRADTMLRYVTTHPRFKIWRWTPDEAFIEELPPVLRYSQLIDSIISHYGRSVYNKTFRHWVEHSPGKALHIPLLARAFPNAAFVHIVRDGRAIAASMRALDWGEKDIVSSSHYWRGRLTLARAGEHEIKNDYFDVRYEDIVQSSGEAVRTLAEKLGVTLPPGDIRTDGFTPPTYTSKQHALVGSPPSAIKLEVWKDQLKAREIEIFEYYNRDLLRRYGYQVTSEEPRKPTYCELAWYFFNGLIQRIAQRPSRWLRQRRAVRA